MKADGRSELGSNDHGAIRNIIAIADGIKNDQWDQVATAGGSELMKIAGKIILKALLPPLGLIPPNLIDPIIDAIIQSRADVIAGVVKAAKNKDVAALGEVIAEAYLVQGFLVPCALPIIPEAIRIAVCKPVGKVIRESAGVVGGVTDLAGDIVKDPLDAPGILTDAISEGVATRSEVKIHTPARTLRRTIWTFIQSVCPLRCFTCRIRGAISLASKSQTVFQGC